MVPLGIRAELGKQAHLHMVNYRVSQEVIPPTRGDVRFLGLGFLLFGCAEQIIVGEPQAMRSHDGHEHVTILVVHDVAGGIFTEWVANLSIFYASVFPRQESPGADERIGCHCPSLLTQRVRTCWHHDASSRCRARTSENVDAKFAESIFYAGG